MTDDYTTLSDTELVNRSLQADDTAFAEIVRRYSPRVFSFAARFFRRYSLIEEAAQEVFLKAFTQLRNFESRGSLEGWLTRITVTTCINILRSNKRQPELTVADLTDNEKDWLEEKLLGTASGRQQTEEDRLIAADLVSRVMETFPPDDGLVLMMIDGEGASIKDVAALLEWSESKVKTRAFRARRQMREAVEKLLAVENEKCLRAEKAVK